MKPRFMVVDGGAVFAWFFGICAGIALTLGCLELVTGRMVEGWGNLSQGETRIRGLILVVAGLWVAIFTLIEGARWNAPDYKVSTALALPTIVVAVGGVFSTVLLQLHHARRWPFNRRRPGELGARVKLTRGAWG